MHHIVAYPMPPVDLMPVRSLRVMLVKQMILAVKINRGMRFIHPVLRRHRMVLRTVLITVEHSRVLINIVIWNFWNHTAVKILYILIFSKNFLASQSFILQLHFIDES
ncbi:hypothetical protein D3C85_1638280 [compost metagenome]